MKSLEEILQGLEYLSEAEVNDPKWTLESLKNFHQSLSDDNFLSYIVYLSLRPDLSDDDRDTCLKIIKIKNALEKREIQKKYSHFETVAS
jgi:hypothetical protein